MGLVGWDKWGVGREGFVGAVGEFFLGGDVVVDDDVVVVDEDGIDEVADKLGLESGVRFGFLGEGEKPGMDFFLI